MRTVTSWTAVDTADGPMRVFGAAPAEPDATRGAVVVLQEAFGVNDHIQDVTRRFADLGHLAVAPDLFHRTGVGPIDYAAHDAAMEQIDALGTAQIDVDVAAVLDHLGAVHGVDPPRVGVVGFCFGGRAAFTAATARPDLACAVAFYGPGVAAGPHAVLGRVTPAMPPVLMLVGDRDPTIPPEHVAAVREACAQAGVDLRVRTFAGAGHAFHCDARPDRYDAGAAALAWADTVAFLAETTSPTHSRGGPR